MRYTISDDNNFFYSNTKFAQIINIFCKSLMNLTGCKIIQSKPQVEQEECYFPVENLILFDLYLKYLTKFAMHFLNREKRQLYLP